MPQTLKFGVAEAPPPVPVNAAPPPWPVPAEPPPARSLRPAVGEGAAAGMENQSGEQTALVAGRASPCGPGGAGVRAARPGARAQADEGLQPAVLFGGPHQGKAEELHQRLTAWFDTGRQPAPAAGGLGVHPEPEESSGSAEGRSVGQRLVPRLYGAGGRGGTGLACLRPSSAVR